MKKTIIRSLLLALITMTGLLNPVKAQIDKKDLLAFTKKFQDSYNKQDGDALKMMYTNDVSRIDPTGAVTTGNDSVVAGYVKSWASSKVTLAIKHEKAETQADGSVITSGTYTVMGTTNAGDKIDVKGAYTNTLVKDKGNWKIAKSVLKTVQ